MLLLRHELAWPRLLALVAGSRLEVVQVAVSRPRMGDTPIEILLLRLVLPLTAEATANELPACVD